MTFGGVDVAVSGRFVRIGRVAAEGFQFVEDPEPVLEKIAKNRAMDLFTFIQPLPPAQPRYRYPMQPLITLVACGGLTFLLGTLASSQPGRWFRRNLAAAPSAN